MVPEVGLEPTLGCPDQILSLARLPIPPLRHRVESGDKCRGWTGTPQVETTKGN